MKDFLYDCFIEPFKDGWFAVLGVFMWLLAIFVTSVILFVTLYLIDSSFLDTKQGEGIVIDKSATPFYTSTTYIMSGKIMIPIVQQHPATWDLKIQIGKLTDNFSLKESDWNNIHIEQMVRCTYTNGRLSNSIYIKNISY